MRWLIKRRPTGVSFFRDGFPYLETVTPTGSMWVQARAQASLFRSLKTAKSALKTVRDLDPDVVLVRVVGSRTR